jgi:hypothetical protein
MQAGGDAGSIHTAGGGGGPGSHSLAMSVAGGAGGGGGSDHRVTLTSGGGDHRGDRDMSEDMRAMVTWVKRLVKLKGVGPSSWTEEHESSVAAFLASPEVRKLVAYVAADGELALLTPYAALPCAPKDFVYFIKREGVAQLTLSKLKAGVQVGAVRGGGMDSLLRLMGDVLMPAVRGTALWPEGVRKDFVGQMHRFMASLVETSHQARGKTMLYLPPEPLPEDPGAAAADKDLVQRLEAAVIHWTRQVRDWEGRGGADARNCRLQQHRPYKLQSLGPCRAVLYDPH